MDYQSNPVQVAQRFEALRADGLSPVEIASQHPELGVSVASADTIAKRLRNLLALSQDNIAIIISRKLEYSVIDSVLRLARSKSSTLSVNQFKKELGLDDEGLSDNVILFNRVGEAFNKHTLSTSCGTDVQKSDIDVSPVNEHISDIPKRTELNAGQNETLDMSLGHDLSSRDKVRDKVRDRACPESLPARDNSGTGINRHIKNVGLSRYRTLMISQFDSWILSHIEKTDVGSIIQKAMALLLIISTFRASSSLSLDIQVMLVGIDMAFLYLWNLDKKGRGIWVVRSVLTTFVLMALISQPVISMIEATDRLDKVEADIQKSEESVSQKTKDNQIKSKSESLAALNSELNKWNIEKHPKQITANRLEREVEDWVLDMQRKGYPFPRNLSVYKSEQQRKLDEVQELRAYGRDLPQRISAFEVQLSKAQKLKVGVFTKRDELLETGAWYGVMKEDGLSTAIRVLLVVVIIFLSPIFHKDRHVS